VPALAAAPSGLIAAGQHAEKQWTTRRPNLTRGGTPKDNRHFGSWGPDSRQVLHLFVQQLKVQADMKGPPFWPRIFRPASEVFAFHNGPISALRGAR
jgi:hypothetical protein